jgi:hypothetical protein
MKCHVVRYKFNDVSEVRRVNQANVTNKTLFTDFFFACYLLSLFFKLKMGRYVPPKHHEPFIKQIQI